MFIRELDKLKMKLLGKIGLMLFLVLLGITNSMCRGSTKTGLPHASELTEGESIVTSIDSYVAKYGKVPASMSGFGSASARWIFIRLDDESYVLSKNLGKTGAKIEYRFGVKHHGSSFVGWFVLDGEKSTHIK